MSFSNKMGNAAIVVAGVFVCMVLTTDLRKHVVELVSHLRSGNWEVMTDRSSVERIVRAKYSGAPQWAITFVAVSGQSLPLTETERRETVMLLGQQTLSDSPALQFNPALLQTTYGGFLAQALLELAVPQPGRNAAVLKNFAASLTRYAGTPPQSFDPDLYSQAQAYLAKQPKTSLLKKALADYIEFGFPRGIDFPAYEVATTPSYDNPGAWDAHAQVLPQSGKCKAKVFSRADQKRYVEANLSLLPRILEVKIERPWLSNALLDNVRNQRGPLTSRHFDINGDLRIIPTAFWVLMPENAIIEATADADRAVISGWGRDNVCCRLVCNDAVFEFSPTSFRQNKDLTFSARRSDLSPLLYAIVSRRRVSN